MQTLNNFRGGHSWIRSSLDTYVYIWKLPLSSISISRAYHMHLLTSDATVGQRVGLWYGKMGVVSEAPSQKSRGIKEFYPVV
jgi:hypothetical protein